MLTTCLDVLSRGLIRGCSCLGLLWLQRWLGRLLRQVVGCGLKVTPLTSELFTQRPLWHFH